MRCLFLAPMKPPDHPEPSGDRTMARLFMRLLGGMGYDVALASRLRAYMTSPCADAFADIAKIAEADIERIVALHQGGDVACVFAYHVYHRSPDLIGPRLAERLGVPYVIAEGSRAPKQAGGPFAGGHALAEKALDAARLVLCLTTRDRAMVERLAPKGQIVATIKPFLDLADWPGAGGGHKDSHPPRLIAVGMMRDKSKLQSYLQLAEAFAILRAPHGGLDIVGDGPARERVEAAFRPFGDKVRFHGALRARSDLTQALNDAHLFVWPAVSEAYGMALVEAQAHGLPCVAGDHGGVADALADGVTGLLTPAGDIRAFAGAVDLLLTDSSLRRRMSRAARRFIVEERSLERAGAMLRNAFAQAGIAAP